MRVHLVDGTYELFRYFFALPSHLTADGRETGAMRGVLGSMLDLIEDGATHLAVATDHVIESFRNELYEGYKTGEGIDPILWSQAHPLEDALRAMGVVVWAMVEFEADDAMAAGAAIAAADPRVDQVLICTPDKDLGQCVKGTRVVQYDRRKDEIVDEAAVNVKFGVPPSSIADYLALVGDSADGYPGLPGWGAKSASTVLAKFGSIDAIPASARDWGLPALRSAEKLARTLQDQMAEALLFRVIATTDLGVPVGVVDDWCWRGPTPELATVAARLGAHDLAERAQRVWERAAARAAGNGGTR